MIDTPLVVVVSEVGFLKKNLWVVVDGGGEMFL